MSVPFALLNALSLTDSIPAQRLPDFGFGQEEAAFVLGRAGRLQCFEPQELQAAHI